MKLSRAWRAGRASSAFVLVPTAAQADPSFYEGPIFGIDDLGQHAARGRCGPRSRERRHRSTRRGAAGPRRRRGSRRGGGLWATTGAGEDPEEDTGQGIWRISGGNATLVANLFEFEAKVEPASGDGRLESVRRRGRGRRKGARRGRGREQPPSRRGRQLAEQQRRESREGHRDASRRARLDRERQVDLRVSRGAAGRLRTAPMIPAQPVATSVAIGPEARTTSASSRASQRRPVSRTSGGSSPARETCAAARAQNCTRRARRLHVDHRPRVRA